MNATLTARPMERTLRTPGVYALAAIAAIGILAAGYRFLFGLAASTNLDDVHPWGLWKAFNVVAGIALAAGGFTTAAFVHVFRRHHFESIARPALLAAVLGYTFAVLALAIDIGRYYSIWHPILPSMWQGNSVLFEVAMCVMVYLTIMYVELIPSAYERFQSDPRFPKLRRVLKILYRTVSPVMTLVIIVGVVVSCLHQSSLGNLMVLAPTKLHPLWYTPILAMLFLLSAVAVGFPAVIVELLVASWALGLKPDVALLGRLARLIPLTLGLYLAAKIGDLVIREAYVHLFHPSWLGFLFASEVGIFGMVPLVMLLFSRIRRSAPWLLFTSALIVTGVALNRLNVVLIGYQPPYATKAYVPSLVEFAVTAGLVATAVLLFRVGVTFLPILSSAWKEQPQWRGRLG